MTISCGWNWNMLFQTCIFSFLCSARHPWISNIRNCFSTHLLRYLFAKMVAASERKVVELQSADDNGDVIPLSDYLNLIFYSFIGCRCSHGRYFASLAEDIASIWYGSTFFSSYNRNWRGMATGSRRLLHQSIAWPSCERTSELERSK